MFEIKFGELIVIVGCSGFGKIILVKFLVGFYLLMEGKVMIDGYDLNQIDKEYYWVQVGYVMQSNLLFFGIIVENIVSGDESFDCWWIEEVVKLVDVYVFISKLLLCYEQIVGECGMGLFGGQIQWFCIVWVFYYDL